MLTVEKNRAPRGPACPATGQAHIARREKELEHSTIDLTTTMRRSPVWREKEDVLRSVPGVGPVLTTMLLANLPELGTLTRQRSGGLSGRRAVPVRQRHPRRPTGDLGWASACGGRPLYGSAGGHAEEPGDSHLLSALVSGGESKKAGVNGLHAETAHHSQCDGEKRNPVAS